MTAPTCFRAAHPPATAGGTDLFQVRLLTFEARRRVIVLRFADEKSIREIAGELGRSEGAVKQLQFRALENLRNRLNEK